MKKINKKAQVLIFSVLCAVLVIAVIHLFLSSFGKKPYYYINSPLVYKIELCETDKQCSSYYFNSMIYAGTLNKEDTKKIQSLVSNTQPGETIKMSDDERRYMIQSAHPQFKIKLITGKSIYVWADDNISYIMIDDNYYQVTKETDSAAREIKSLGNSLLEVPDNK